MTTLVTIGCSHTAGSMIDGVSGTGFYNSNHSFGGLLAKKHNMNHYQLGRPGASNQYIYRSTLHFINNYLNPNDDYIFLIGWTSTNRIELRYPEHTSDVHTSTGHFVDSKYIPFTAGTDPKLFSTREVRQLSELSPLLFYESQLESDWAVYAYTLQTVLKHHNLKYYMFNTCHELPQNNDNKNIIEQLDKDFYYEPTDFDNSMLYWALNKGFKKTKCWHLKADGHQAWMEHLEYLMNQQNLLTNINVRKYNKTIPSNSVRIGGKTILFDDVNDILKKYRIEADIFMDTLYDKVYLLYNEDDSEKSMKIKTNMINKDLVKRFGPTSKISRFDNNHRDMDHDFLLNYFRRLNTLD